MQHLQEFQCLQKAGLTVNPRKCAIAKPETEYPGFIIGGGIIKLQVNKTQSIEECPLP